MDPVSLLPYKGSSKYGIMTTETQCCPQSTRRAQNISTHRPSGTVTCLNEANCGVTLVDRFFQGALKNEPCSFQTVILYCMLAFNMRYKTTMYRL